MHNVLVRRRNNNYYDYEAKCIITKYFNELKNNKGGPWCSRVLPTRLHALVCTHTRVRLLH